MSVVQVQLTAAGFSTAIPINLKNFKFGVGLLVNIPDGVSAGVSVQVSGDVLTDPTDTWNLHDVLQDLSESTNSSLAYPVSMVRLWVTSTDSSTDPITLSVIQAE